MAQQIACRMRTKKKYNEQSQEIDSLLCWVAGPAPESLHTLRDHSVSAQMFYEQALICSITLLILGGINRLNEEGRKKETVCTGA